MGDRVARLKGGKLQLSDALRLFYIILYEVYHVLEKA